MVSQTDARNPEILGHARELDAPVALKVHDITVGALRSSVLVLDRGRAGHAERPRSCPAQAGSRLICGLPRRQLRGGLGGQHHHAFLRLFPFSCFGRKPSAAAFRRAFPPRPSQPSFPAEGPFPRLRACLRLFRKRIGRRNFTHRGRCGLFRRDSGIGCGSRRFGRILTRRVSSAGGIADISSGAALPRSVRCREEPELRPYSFRIAQGRQHWKSGHILRKGARHHLAFARVHPEHGIPTPRARREKA